MSSQPFLWFINEFLSKCSEESKLTHASVVAVHSKAFPTRTFERAQRVETLPVAAAHIGHLVTFVDI